MGPFSVTHVAGGRLDPPFYPTKPEPYIEGFKLNIQSTDTVVAYPVSFPFDVEFYAIAIAASRYDEADFWEIKVGEQYIVKSCYIKRLPEGKNLLAFKAIAAGTPITFIYSNGSSAPKSLMVDYHFQKD